MTRSPARRQRPPRGHGVRRHPGLGRREARPYQPRRSRRHPRARRHLHTQAPASLSDPRRSHHSRPRSTLLHRARHIADYQRCFRRVAQTLYRARGFVIHHNTDIWAMPCPSMASAPPSGPWAARGSAFMSGTIYDVTRDRDFLARRAYPTMKERRRRRGIRAGIHKNAANMISSFLEQRCPHGPNVLLEHRSPAALIAA